MRKTFRIAFLAVLAAPAVALASGFEVINVNPRDLALSSSGVAAQEDAAATFQNPAALSKLSGLNLSLAGSMLSLRTKWTGTAAYPGKETTKFAPTPPVAMYVAYGTKLAGRGLGFGLGVGTPGGGQMKWDDQWEGRGRIITVERRMLGFYLNGGYEIAPWLRVGGGAIYYEGIQYLKQGIQPFPDAYAELDTKGGGFAYQLSAEVKPLENLTLGFDYKHKGTMHMKGDAHFQVPPSLVGPTTQDQDVKQDLTFPNRIDTGLAWRVAKPVLVTLQYSWSRFVVYNQDLFEGETTAITVPRDYRNGNVIRGGVEWTALPTLRLRAGMMRDWSGLRTSTLSPTLPDSNTTGYSLGAGWDAGADFGLNAAVFYGDRDKQTSTGTAAFPGSYKTDVWIVALGFTWRTDLGNR
ncbi:membrane protein involved in aromatic hydrocarbon degradation [Anaeromyxobacter dehalogenans 2CP-1]|uniref:Membrane protein involved in aromatic hydrocarbon degradation n=1 Tax=Anaeromyxobacter dehalogenans (strain ATCC BAA-258 / DSM 21875 / 2CP-1) TaxID=455488 RepID=B8J7R5_ANAD2|nr:outer membrane protein transport protein [Anaeromyxobacter dehalogenans]ACL63407.1 membrane protein involved in aromatic hydrocarbon degradation [Anaeromyxobacter dehalogenans 2CP-1]